MFIRSLNKDSFCIPTLKIHFSLVKKLQYGNAVYVVGDAQILGSWTIQNSLRLNWNEGDQWSGYVIVQKKSIKSIQYKYVISKWDNPSKQLAQWEQGQHNRTLSIQTNKNSLLCNDKWGFDKIRLFLFVNPQFQSKEYYIVGNILQLGNWKSKKKLKLIQGKQLSNENLIEKQGLKNKEGSIYTIKFQVPRNQKYIQYYYIKKDIQIVAQRHPGRFIYLKQKDRKHPQCLYIDHKLGDVQIYENCSFDRLHFSMITQKIFLGSYLKTRDDFQHLKNKGINIVLGIQADQDYNSHSLSCYYLSLLCKQYDIQHYSYSIKDMNKCDFIEKSLGAFLLLSKLLSSNDAKVYIHCSAGMYRSPQIVVIYLVLVNGYSLQEAINIVIQKHPFARPNQSLISQALYQISKKINQVILD